ncbi:hypothetical protein MKX01_018797 [Papaver californicum]|nr:hypothetical protein MKX01_018797 [Papaver californicum]
MRFKCVSKHWHSIIHKDPYFINLHLNQSKARTSFLVTVPRERSWSRDDDFFWQLLIYCAKAGKCQEFTKPLNGFICLFDPEKNHGVRVCNLSTREVKTWIKSTFISNLDVEDEYNNGYRTNTWTAFTIELPIYLGYGVDRRSLRFHSVTGTDFIILYLYIWNRIWRDYYFAPEVSYYSYNWSKNKHDIKVKVKVKVNN